MEIRPDRFKAVAAKTLGKIYGYVKSLWDTLLPEHAGTQKWLYACDSPLELKTRIKLISSDQKRPLKGSVYP